MKEISLFVLVAGTKTHPSPQDLLAYLNGMTDTYREEITKLFNFSKVEFEPITPPLLEDYFSIPQTTHRNLHFCEMYGFFGTPSTGVEIDLRSLKDFITTKVFDTLLQDTFLEGRVTIIPHYLKEKTLEMYTLTDGYIQKSQPITDKDGLYILNNLIRESMGLEVDPKFKAQVLLLSRKDKHHDS